MKRANVKQQEQEGERQGYWTVMKREKRDR